jgi:aryl-alcohol dehydrogenase-like predicted oxidoreductase
MMLGNETDEQGSHAQLDRLVEAGGTPVDTADGCMSALGSARAVMPIRA